MTLNCSSCDLNFETKTRLYNHRMSEHQRAAKLTFAYGIYKLTLDNSTETVQIQQGSAICCPRCEKSFSTSKSLREHCLGTA